MPRFPLRRWARVVVWLSVRCWGRGVCRLADSDRDHEALRRSEAVSRCTGQLAATVHGVATGNEQVLEIDGHELRITHPDKVFFSERGDTKLDLVNHYLRFAEPLMRTMGDRPTLMQRFPEGA